MPVTKKGIIEPKTRSLQCTRPILRAIWLSARTETRNKCAGGRGGLMLKPVDPIETLLQRIREEDGLAREADERHDVRALEGHNAVVDALLERVRRMPLMSLAGVAAVLETAEALVAESGADADEADLVDAA